MNPVGLTSQYAGDLDNVLLGVWGSEEGGEEGGEEG
jgi:hypothetical protein